MPRHVLKLVVSIVVVGASLALLLYRSAGGTIEYYQHVDEIAGQDFTGKSMQLHGFITPGSIQTGAAAGDEGGRERRFLLTNCGHSLEVRHRGPLPDGFRDGAEVVCHGQLAGGVFSSHEITTKCPSKYRASAESPALCASSVPRRAQAAPER